MSNEETARNYLRDLGPLLKELALESKAARDSAPEGEERAYAAGRLMGLHEAVSLVQQQADAFGMDRDAVGLGDVEPERDLL